MSKILSQNTEIETIVFRGLRKLGLKFRKYYKKILGNPDAVFLDKKIAIFIDGDFWHGYKFIKLKRRLSKKYWLNKILTNIERDKRINKILKKQGWKVLRFWEHDIKKNQQKCLEKIIRHLK
jgi:DNA mismatch endonuclease (patch repair protein)